MSAEILRKLTIKNVGLTVATIKEAVVEVAEGQSVPLMKVVGKTTSAAKGQTDKGEYTLFGGDFFAVNLITGETFTSQKAILPGFIADTLSVALAQSPSVEFGLEIGAKNKPDAVTGYEFTVRPVIETKPSESVQTLLAAAGIDPNAERPALPAPAPKAPAKKTAAKK